MTSVVPYEQLSVVETANLDASNADGSITLPAEDDTWTPVVRADAIRDEAVVLLTVGATDAADVEWRLRVGQRPLLRTQSPLGTLTDALMTADVFGDPIAADRDIVYEARNLSGTETNVAGRMVFRHL